jgi:hypothetical protein
MSANLTVQEENELLSLCADNDNAESIYNNNNNNNNNNHGDGGGGENDATQQGGKRKRPPKPKKSKIYTKKNMRPMSDSELFIEFDKDLESISNEATCFSQSTTGSGTCTCLHILRQPHLRATVANYKVGLRNKSKHEVDSIIFEWYRYAKSCADEKKGRHKPYWYMMPFDGTDALANGVDIKEIVTARICQQGMFRVMGITEARMATIRQASITGVVPVHASRGRKSNNAMSDDAHAIMMTHFQELCQIGVQTQPTAAGEVADINLPLPYSARGCYRIYLKALGYSVKYSTNGSITVHWDGNEDDEKPKYMSATTYFAVWKREFPHLKVSLLMAPEQCNFL